MLQVQTYEGRQLEEDLRNHPGEGVRDHGHILQRRQSPQRERKGAADLRLVHEEVLQAYEVAERRRKRAAQSCRGTEFGRRGEAQIRQIFEQTDRLGDRPAHSVLFDGERGERGEVADRRRDGPDDVDRGQPTMRTNLSVGIDNELRAVGRIREALDELLAVLEARPFRAPVQLPPQRTEEHREHRRLAHAPRGG